MRKLIIPNSVQIEVLDEKTNSVETREFEFSEFVINNALLHRAFGSNIETLEMSERLTQKLEASKPGDELDLEDKTWALLNTVVNHPEHPYSDVKLLRKLLPFLRAINDATQETK